MARRLWANSARCKLGADIVTTGAVATLTLETGKGALFPSPSGGNWFILSVEDSSKNVECFKISSRTGDILTVSGAGSDRAQEGTTARTFTAATSVCGIRPTKAAFEAIDDHIEDVTAAHAASAISTSGGYSDAQSYLAGLAASIASLSSQLVGVLMAPAGTRMAFQQTAAPTGWTKDTTYNDRALRVVSGSVTSGGATAFTTVFGSGKTTGGTSITQAHLPAVNFNVTDPGHVHGMGINEVDSGHAGGGGFPVWGTGAGAANTSSATTGITVGSGGSGTAHDHTLSLDLHYLDLIIASKN